jgi:hypothetical protein
MANPIHISPRSTFAQASLAETLATMSAVLCSNPAFTIAMPRDRRDAAAMLADPQVAQALRAAIDAFVQAIGVGQKL